MFIYQVANLFLGHIIIQSLLSHCYKFHNIALSQLSVAFSKAFVTFQPKCEWDVGFACL